jgi:hypothetical protein
MGSEHMRFGSKPAWCAAAVVLFVGGLGAASGCGMYGGEDWSCDGNDLVHEWDEEFLNFRGSGDGGRTRTDCGTQGGVCAEQGGSADCVAAGLEACTPGGGRCAGPTTVQRCSASVGRYLVEEPCEDGAVCHEIGGRAACVHPDRVACVPGQRGCSADRAARLVCDAESGYLVAGAAPPEPGLACVTVRGQEIWAVAPPRRCVAGAHVESCWDALRVVVCGPSGYEEIAPCPSGWSCVLGPNGAAGCWGEAWGSAS